MTDRCRLWLAAAVLAALSLLLARRATAEWPAGTAQRLSAAAETIRAAAGTHGVDPGLLGAILATETGCRAIRGGRGDSMWGPGQIAWQWWGGRLRSAGIADSPEALLDLVAGIEATAFVLGELRRTYPAWPEWRRICAYGAGPGKARTFRSDCAYSRAVLRAVPLAAKTISGGQQ